MHGLVGPSKPLLPASELTLIYFASHLAQTVSYDTVKLYLVAVQDLHRELNFPLYIEKMHRLKKVLTSIKRLVPSTKRDRFPITTQILTTIHNYLHPALSTNLDHIMLWAAFTLAFFGFLRASEFTCNGPFNPEVHLTSQDIIFHPDMQSPSLMRVKITQSKTFPPRMHPHHNKVHLTHLFCDGDERLHSPNPASSKPSFVYILSIWLVADPLKPHQGAPVYSRAMWLPIQQLLLSQLLHWSRHICSLSRYPFMANQRSRTVEFRLLRTLY